MKILITLNMRAITYKDLLTMTLLKVNINMYSMLHLLML
jgi:hypothetical protein